MHPRLLAAGASLVLLAGAVDAGVRATDSPSRRGSPTGGSSTMQDGPDGTQFVPTPTISASASATATRITTAKPTGDDVHGIVTDALGKPLAHVHVAYDVSLPDAPSYQPVAVTDDRGRFAVPCLHRPTEPTEPALLFASYAADTGAVDPRAPDIAWSEAAQQCGPAAGLGMTVATSPGAALDGTLYQHGHPVHAPGVRIGVQCDSMPRGNVNAFVVQVLVDVDATDGHYRITGLHTDHCAIGVFDRPGARAREVVEDVQVDAGRTKHLDVHDNGQDYFTGGSSPGGGGGSPSPRPSPSSTCLAICPP